MSVSFWPAIDETGKPYVSWDAVEDATINLANANARDLLVYLGFLDTEDLLYGSHSVQDLRAKCARKLWDEVRNKDPSIPAWNSKTSKEPPPAILGDLMGIKGPRVVYAGRRPNYLQDRCKALLKVCDWAASNGASYIAWG